jgi:hypothetical protein
MKTTLLVQRAQFKKPEPAIPNPYQQKPAKGIDKLLKFDYMGAAEFENGALPKSLARIRGNSRQYSLTTYLFKMSTNKVVKVFCLADDVVKVGEVLEQLAEKTIRLKERCDLSEYILNIGTEFSNDFWWDIENDFMFWKDDSRFTVAFMDALIPRP